MLGTKLPQVTQHLLRWHSCSPSVTKLVNGRLSMQPPSDIQPQQIWHFFNRQSQLCVAATLTGSALSMTFSSATSIASSGGSWVQETYSQKHRTSRSSTT